MSSHVTQAQRNRWFRRLVSITPAEAHCFEDEATKTGEVVGVYYDAEDDAEGHTVPTHVGRYAIIQSGGPFAGGYRVATTMWGKLAQTIVSTIESLTDGPDAEGFTLDKVIDLETGKEVTYTLTATLRRPR